ncbi:MAG: aminotransferase class I/II-fold pyridoxal phosphate-dependent enzyme [Hyphomicrobiales bacterium]
MVLDIPSMLRWRGRTDSSGASLISAQREVTRADELEAFVSSQTARLRALGFGGDDRIAVALPEGPAFAKAILAAACAAICAPVDCGVPLPQLVRNLTDIRARAIILGPSQARDLSSALGQAGLMVLVLDPRSGELRISNEAKQDRIAAAAHDIDPDAPALLFHTSGTTAKPKVARPWFLEVDRLQADVEKRGGRYTSFAHYDYLGLSRHPEVLKAAESALGRYGAGASASRLVGAEYSVQRELETALAAFTGRGSVLALVSGYLTNVTLLAHLLGKGDLILYDELSHNSISVFPGCSAGTRRFSCCRGWPPCLRSRG